MQKHGTLLIVGRGPSAYTFDGWEGHDVMAVSSGIFALPDGLLPQHFVSMDAPRYFVGPINEHPIAWGNDEQARDWPFWADERIAKHVSQVLLTRGTHLKFPLAEVMKVLPEYAHKPFFETYDAVQHEFGYQPGWLDYPNVTGWPLVLNIGPNFSASGPLGLSNMRNSVFMAVQVAARLGYRDMRFVGVFDGEGYEQHREAMAAWHTIATQHGITWSNLGAASLLGSVLPTLESAA